eukprot:3662152-Pyramimonas_sp.AAC.1
MTGHSLTPARTQPVDSCPVGRAGLCSESPPSRRVRAPWRSGALFRVAAQYDFCAKPRGAEPILRLCPFGFFLFPPPALAGGFCLESLPG